MESTAQLIDAGLTVTLIGMSVVFILLTTLVGVVTAMSALCRRFFPEAPPVERVFEGPLGVIPFLRGSRILFRIFRVAHAQLELEILEATGPQHIDGKPDGRIDLVGDLLG